MRENPLREWRRARNMTALDVALKLDVSEQSVLSWERGRFEPSTDNVSKLAALMSIEPNQIRLHWHIWKAAQNRT